jgi:hypothetical protein
MFLIKNNLSVVLKTKKVVKMPIFRGFTAINMAILTEMSLLLDKSNRVCYTSRRVVTGSQRAK